MLRTRVKAGWLAGLLLSFATAALLTLVQCSELWSARFSPVLGFQTPVSLRVPYGAVDHHPSQSAFYDAHRNFVPVGTLLSVHDPAHRAATAYEQARRPPKAGTALGEFIILGTLLLSLAAYIRKFG